MVCLGVCRDCCGSRKDGISQGWQDMGAGMAWSGGALSRGTLASAEPWRVAPTQRRWVVEMVRSRFPRACPEWLAM